MPANAVQPAPIPPPPSAAQIENPAPQTPPVALNINLNCSGDLNRNGRKVCEQAIRAGLVATLATSGKMDSRDMAAVTQQAMSAGKFNFGGKHLVGIAGVVAKTFLGLGISSNLKSFGVAAVESAGDNTTIGGDGIVGDDNSSLNPSTIINTGEPIVGGPDDELLYP